MPRSRKSSTASDRLYRVIKFYGKGGFCPLFCIKKFFLVMHLPPAERPSLSTEYTEHTEKASNHSVLFVFSVDRVGFDFDFISVHLRPVKALNLDLDADKI